MHAQVREGSYHSGLKFYFTTGSLDEIADRLALGREGGQAALDYFLLALPLGHFDRISVGAIGEIAYRGQDALVFSQRGRFRPE